MEIGVLILSGITLFTSLVALYSSIRAVKTDKMPAPLIQVKEQAPLSEQQIEAEIRRRHEYEEKVKKTSELIYHYAVAQAARDILGRSDRENEDLSDQLKP